jgi:hypothetical protein
VCAKYPELSTSKVIMVLIDFLYGFLLFLVKSYLSLLACQSSFVFTRGREESGAPPRPRQIQIHPLVRTFY